MSNFTNGLPYNATLDQKILYSFYIAEKTCSLPSVLWYAEVLPGIGINFHDLMTILASVATVFCCLISLYITCGHFFHWTNPHEQKQIVLCIWYLPIFTIINFFGLWFYHSYDYIVPFLQLYNAKGLIALFLLYVAYMCPNESERDMFHAELERRWFNGKVKHNRGSLKWFRMIWVLVFQLVPLQLIIFVGYYVIHKTTCPLSKARETATIIIGVAQYLITSAAWTAIWLYHRRVRDHLVEHRPLWKLNAFQGLVALQATQSLVFSFIGTYRGYFPTRYVSYQDFTDGVPAFMLCWESFIFSILFIRAFSFSPYRKQIQIHQKQGQKLSHAFSQTVNQWDIIHGTALMFTIMFSSAKHEERKGNKISDNETATESVRLSDME